MRILIFNWRDITHPWAGGAELNIHEQARRWVQAGCEVTLFCGEYPGAERHAQLDGINIVRRGGRFTVYLWAVVYYLFSFRGKYDIILDLENGIPFFTPLYVRKPKVCLFHHIHTQQFRHEFSPPLSWIGVFLESVLMPWVYRRETFITISESSRAELERIGIDPGQTVVVYCGVDHELYRPEQAKTEAPSLVYLGRLMQYKRVDKLIRMMPPILAQSPDVMLHIIGTGPEQDRLQALARQLGVERQIVFHGRLSEEKKVSLLQQAWVLVIASIKEGWGLVVIEANACGTPAISFAVPGLSEAIRNPHTGLLAESEQEYVQSLMDVLKKPELREHLSNSARQYSCGFSWDETATRTLEILAWVVRRRENGKR